MQEMAPFSETVQPVEGNLMFSSEVEIH